MPQSVFDEQGRTSVTNYNLDCARRICTWRRTFNNSEKKKVGILGKGGMDSQLSLPSRSRGARLPLFSRLEPVLRLRRNGAPNSRCVRDQLGRRAVHQLRIDPGLDYRRYLVVGMA